MTRGDDDDLVTPCRGERSPLIQVFISQPQSVRSSLIAMKTKLIMIICAALPLSVQNIVGIPTIKCSPEGVRAYVNLSDSFTGHIYLKGHYGREGCHRDFQKKPMAMDPSGTHMADAEFRFDACPMRRKRQINPRGLIMSGVMVVAHHSTLLTYRDRAYRVECYYREDNNVVQTEMRVNSQPPSPLASDPIPLPSCQYKVEMAGNSSSHDVSPAIVTIGDSVVHVWTCGEPVHTHIYCMQVHSCVADDGGREKVTVVDADGCSSDSELLSALTYPTPLRAFARSRVFKFADKSDINFACQIRLMMKQDAVNGTCPVCVMEFVEGPQLFRSKKKICYIYSADPLLGVRCGGTIDDSSGEETNGDLRSETRADLPSVDCSTGDLFDVI
ncbi:zona pellucida-like domain protein [Ancylostoma caninum]|uniref:Zona pellucida-like domain protein n=1 Tax=Ancylostoma caninum TaxID=29170 RepID=A0A368FQX0_ANCCA|nr:zona pellucida-like domain protein [Ancylostoma caninum]